MLREAVRRNERRLREREGRRWRWAGARRRAARVRTGAGGPGAGSAAGVGLRVVIRRPADHVSDPGRARQQRCAGGFRKIQRGVEPFGQPLGGPVSGHPVQVAGLFLGSPRPVPAGHQRRVLAQGVRRVAGRAARRRPRPRAGRARSRRRPAGGSTRGRAVGRLSIDRPRRRAAGSRRRRPSRRGPRGPAARSDGQRWTSSRSTRPLRRAANSRRRCCRPFAEGQTARLRPRPAPPPKRIRATAQGTTQSAQRVIRRWPRGCGKHVGSRGEPPGPAASRRRAASMRASSPSRASPSSAGREPPGPHVSRAVEVRVVAGERHEG